MTDRIEQVKEWLSDAGIRGESYVTAIAKDIDFLYQQPVSEDLREMIDTILLETFNDGFIYGELGKGKDDEVSIMGKANQILSLINARIDKALLSERTLTLLGILTEFRHKDIFRSFTANLKQGKGVNDEP